MIDLPTDPPTPTPVEVATCPRDGARLELRRFALDVYLICPECSASWSDVEGVGLTWFAADDPEQYGDATWRADPAIDRPLDVGVEGS